MKKQLLMLTLIGFSFLWGQERSKTLSALKPGKLLLGGDFSYVNKDNNKSYDVAVVPNIGYFLSKDLVVGLGTGFKYQYTKAPETEQGVGLDLEQNTFLFKPYVRKYFNTNNRFLPTVDLYGNFSWSKNATHKMGSKGTYAWGVGVSPGFSYRLNNWFFVNTSVGDFGYHWDGKSNYGLQLNMADLKLGVSFML